MVTPARQVRGLRWRHVFDDCAGRAVFAQALQHNAQLFTLPVNVGQNLVAAETDERGVVEAHSDTRTLAVDVGRLGVLEGNSVGWGREHWRLAGIAGMRDSIYISRRLLSTTLSAIHPALEVTAVVRGVSGGRRVPPRGTRAAGVVGRRRHEPPVGVGVLSVRPDGARQRAERRRRVHGGDRRGGARCGRHPKHLR